MDKEQDRSISLTIPGEAQFVLVARMALSGFGMMAGLEVDLIDDLRTITDECCDCLMHQRVALSQIRISAAVKEKRLACQFCAVRGETGLSEPVQDKEITRCILETLLPDVKLHCDEDGVCCIDFSMPL